MKHHSNLTVDHVWAASHPGLVLHKCRMLSKQEKEALLAKWDVSSEDKKVLMPTFLAPLRVRPAVSRSL
jgi:hypothetical protein